LMCSEGRLATKAQSPRSRTKKDFVDLRVFVSLWRDSSQHAIAPLPEFECSSAFSAAPQSNERRKTNPKVAEHAGMAQRTRTTSFGLTLY
jgi:hypothetical protein